MAKKIFALILTLTAAAGLSVGSIQGTRTITGVVTAFKTVPLNKVRITSVKAGEIAYTDSAGFFSIKCSTNDILAVSAAGFRGRKIKTGDEDLFKIDLSYSDSPSNFNDATRNGHISGEILRQSLLKKPSKIDRDYSKYKSIYELISSEIYNVRVKGNSVVNTKVRSFDSNPQVLYVVDDVIVSDISYINPDYVKSIEFIDDVGTTLYGAKGANGVLKITLK